MINLLGRYQLLEAHQLILPQKCVCGNMVGQFIDTGVDIQDWGIVYICTTCFRDMAVQFGYCPVGEREALNLEVDSLKQIINRLKEENGKFRNAFNIINNVRDSNFDNIESDRDLDNFIDTLAKSESTNNQSHGRAKQRSIKQNDERRSTDLRDFDISKGFDPLG